jgi:hypothetical protein
VLIVHERNARRRVPLLMDALPHLGRTDLENGIQRLAGAGLRPRALTRTPVFDEGPLAVATRRWGLPVSVSCKSDSPLEFSDFSRVLTK